MEICMMDSHVVPTSGVLSDSDILFLSLLVSFCNCLSTLHHKENLIDLYKKTFYSLCVDGKRIHIQVTTYHICSERIDLN